MRAASIDRAVVVGAGVNGLTCALALQSRGVAVELWSRDAITETTSAISAAFWYPFSVGPEAGVRRWSAAALRDFSAIGELDEAHGVRQHRVVELFPERVDAPGWRELLPDLRHARPEELRRGRKAGWVFSAPVIDTSRYLPWLASRVERAGGRFVQREVKSLDEALEASPVVINCSGLGARELANDGRVYPIRGELVRCPPLEEQSAADFGVWLDEHGPEIRYVVPRADDTVLGGTYEPERVDDRLDPEHATQIFEGCAELIEELGRRAPLEHRVGWRPARDEVRQEIETRPAGQIAHNYGHGGAGVTLSWGCARELLGQLGLELGARPWDVS